WRGAAHTGLEAATGHPRPRHLRRQGPFRGRVRRPGEGREGERGALHEVHVPGGRPRVPQRAAEGRLSARRRERRLEQEPSVPEEQRALMSTTLSPITSINPATGEVLARFDPFTHDEVDHALDEAQDAFIAWRERSFEERAVPMRRLASLLRGRVDRYGRLITLEMGKPIVEAKAELEKCALGCEHYAD